MKFRLYPMPILRLAYTTQFLIALIAVFVLWSQIGGQGHVDLIPWYIKLGLGAGSAFAIVKATVAAVSREPAWNGGTLKWLGIMLALLIGCGLVTYYVHIYDESDEDQDQQDSGGVSRLQVPGPWFLTPGPAPSNPASSNPIRARFGDIIAPCVVGAFLPVPLAAYPLSAADPEPEKRVYAFGDGIPHTASEYAQRLASLTAKDDLKMDDYSRGGVVETLESNFAALLGKEAAVWLPTGTLAKPLGGSSARRQSAPRVGTGGEPPFPRLRRLRPDAERLEPGSPGARQSHFHTRRCRAGRLRFQYWTRGDSDRRHSDRNAGAPPAG